MFTLLFFTRPLLSGTEFSFNYIQLVSSVLHDNIRLIVIRLSVMLRNFMFACCIVLYTTTTTTTTTIVTVLGMNRFNYR
jgi:hypothetical protein